MSGRIRGADHEHARLPEHEERVPPLARQRVGLDPPPARGQAGEPAVRSPTATSSRRRKSTYLQSGSSVPGASMANGSSRSRCRRAHPDVAADWQHSTGCRRERDRTVRGLRRVRPGQSLEAAAPSGSRRAVATSAAHSSRGAPRITTHQASTPTTSGVRVTVQSGARILAKLRRGSLGSRALAPRLREVVAQLTHICDRRPRYVTSGRDHQASGPPSERPIPAIHRSGCRGRGGPPKP